MYTWRSVTAGFDEPIGSVFTIYLFVMDLGSPGHALLTVIVFIIIAILRCSGE